MSLYKYCKPNLADKILPNRTIRFSPVTEFNDPFECLPSTQELESSNTVQIITESIAKKRDAEESIRAVLEKQPKQFTLDGQRRMVAEKYAQDLLILKSGLHKASLSSRTNWRVLCLSMWAPNDPHALPLWSRYAEDHSGFVLEFADEHPWVQEYAKTNSEKRDGGPVQYRPERTGVDLKDDGEFYLRREAVFTKSIAWAHEAEYRLLSTVGQPELDTSVRDALVQFPADALVGITFGLNIKSETEITILEAVRAYPHRVSLRRAFLHFDKYQIRLSDVV